MSKSVPKEFQWWDTLTRWRPIMPENLVPLLFNERELTPEQNKRCEQLYDIAEQQYEKGSFKEAINNLNELLKIDQVDIAAWLLIGYCYLELGLIREAWRSYKFAWYYDRFDSELLQAMAQLLIEIKDYQLARYIIWDWLLAEESEEAKNEIDSYIAEYCKALGLNETTEKQLIAQYHQWLDSLNDEDLELFECTLEELDEILAQYDPGPENPEPVEYPLFLELDFEALKTRCRECNFPLPLDAPYCFGCGAPHIYLDIKEENEYTG